MNKIVKKVFMLVGLLVVIFIAWQLVFNKGGILKTGYNALAYGINDQWAKVSGSSTLVPVWNDTNADDNNEAFKINTTK